MSLTPAAMELLTAAFDRADARARRERMVDWRNATKTDDSGFGKALAKLDRLISDG